MILKVEKQLAEITIALKNLMSENLEMRKKIVELEALLARRESAQCDCSVAWSVDIHGNCSNCGKPRQ